ncbi:Ig-like domain-containing protein, partial [Chloroflexota bacterium]
DSGQSMGSSYSYGINLGDVDGDGDLDAFVANISQANRVWLNDGSGNFSDSGQSLGSSTSHDVSLGDVDGDGDLDAFVANSGQGNKVWLNLPLLSISSKTPAANALDVAQTSNITVQFSTSINGATVNQTTFNVDGSMSGNVSGSYSGGGTDTIIFNPASDFKASETVTVTLTTGIKGENDARLASSVTWRFMVEAPQGYANFVVSGQSLGSSASYRVVLGDIDGDGDLDAFVVNDNQANRVWLNDGSGNFTDSEQSLGNSLSRAVSLGDIDGDGDFDAFVANRNQANRVWVNDASGNFTDSGQALGSSASLGIALGDVDGDGDLDAFVANYYQANMVWLNVPPSGCFIATAAYGSYLDSHVDTLRDFRDRYLMTNPIGRSLIYLYYDLSPPIAEFINEHPALKPVVRVGLLPAVALSAIAINTTLVEKIAILGLMILVSFALATRTRKRRGKSKQHNQG